MHQHKENIIINRFAYIKSANENDIRSEYAERNVFTMKKIAHSKIDHLIIRPASGAGESMSNTEKKQQLVKKMQLISFDSKKVTV